MGGQKSSEGIGVGVGGGGGGREIQVRALGGRGTSKAYGRGERCIKLYDFRAYV